MKILKSIFTFTEEIKKNFNAVKIGKFVDEVVRQIKIIENVKQLSFEEKKARLDCYITDWLIIRLDSDNIFLDKIFDLIIDNVPYITQIIYNVLKAKFEKIKAE